MTVSVSSLTAFSLGAGAGRTREPLDILGQMALVKLASTDTDGAAAVLSSDSSSDVGSTHPSPLARGRMVLHT